MKNQGFQLIELLVVISIVAVIAAVSVPFYRNYKLRVHVMEKVNPILETAVKQSTAWASAKGKHGQLQGSLAMRRIHNYPAMMHV